MANHGRDAFVIPASGGEQFQAPPVHQARVKGMAVHAHHAVRPLLPTVDNDRLLGADHVSRRDGERHCEVVVRGRVRLLDDARRVAHQTQDLELVTYILGNMATMARWQGDPRIGIDHAIAMRAWAAKTGSPHAEAYPAAVSAEMFAADGQADECRRSLDAEQAAYLRH
jgi:hypothetical protein